MRELRPLAKEVEAALQTIPGARDIAANREVMIQSLPIRYRAQDLAAAGLTPAMVAEQVQDALYGEVVAEVNQGVRRYDIVVRLAPEERERIEQIRQLMLRGQGGAIVRLEDVADIGVEMTSNLIAREAPPQGGDLVQCRGRLQPGRPRFGGPSEGRSDCSKGRLSVHYGGQFEAQQSASRTILVMGAASCW